MKENRKSVVRKLLNKTAVITRQSVKTVATLHCTKLRLVNFCEAS